MAQFCPFWILAGHADEIFAAALPNLRFDQTRAIITKDVSSRRVGESHWGIRARDVEEEVSLMTIVEAVYVQWKGWKSTWVVRAGPFLISLLTFSMASRGRHVVGLAR
jgi:hypothetical protein